MVSSFASQYEFRYLALWLCGALIAVFFLQQIFPAVTDAFVLQADSWTSEPWTLLTATFLHGSFSHLLSNLFALGLFGLLLEKYIGSRLFLAVYFAGGLAASLAAAFFYPASLGASGAIFAAMGMLAVLRPTMVVWVSYVPMPMMVAIVVWGALDLFGVLVPSNVANLAHIGGMLFGLVCGILFLWRYPQPKRTKRQPLDTGIERALDSYERRAGLR